MPGDEDPEEEEDSVARPRVIERGVPANRLAAVGRQQEVTRDLLSARPSKLLSDIVDDFSLEGRSVSQGARIKEHPHREFELAGEPHISMWRRLVCCLSVCLSVRARLFSFSATLVYNTFLTSVYFYLSMSKGTRALRDRPAVPLDPQPRLLRGVTHDVAVCLMLFLALHLRIRPLFRLLQPPLNSY